MADLTNVLFNLTGRYFVHINVSYFNALGICVYLCIADLNNSDMTDLSVTSPLTVQLLK